MSDHRSEKAPLTPNPNNEPNGIVVQGETPHLPTVHKHNTTCPHWPPHTAPSHTGRGTLLSRTYGDRRHCNNVTTRPGNNRVRRRGNGKDVNKRNGGPVWNGAADDGTGDGKGTLTEEQLAARRTDTKCPHLHGGGLINARRMYGVMNARLRIVSVLGWWGPGWGRVGRPATPLHL
ncbi:hypothetical protein J6590_004351 [Homalodisca vitripennis]|nr:hypothetical protein J6590_004351 [Homalodisca vitripennis]